MLELGSIVQKGGKVVHAWAVEGDLDPAHGALEHVRDGVAAASPARTASFPEIDRVAWFDPAEARIRIKATQIPLLERLEAVLGVSLPSEAKRLRDRDSLSLAAPRRGSAPGRPSGSRRRTARTRCRRHRG